MNRKRKINDLLWIIVSTQNIWHNLLWSNLHVFLSEEIMYPVIDNLEYIVKEAITKPTTTDSKK